MTEDVSNQDPAAKPTVAETLAVPNEFIERLRSRIPKLEKVETSAGAFYMRRTTGGDQYQLLLLRSVLQEKGHTHLPPALVVASALMNENGKPLFANLDQGFEFCNDLEDKLLDELYDHALRITGLGARAIEDAEKKSLSSQSSDSGTSSSH